MIKISIKQMNLLPVILNVCIYFDRIIYSDTRSAISRGTNYLRHAQCVTLRQRFI